MASLAAARQALASALAPISGLRVSAIFTGQVNPPQVIIMPQPQQSFRFDTFDGGVAYLLRIVLLTQYTEDGSSQSLLDSYLAPGGASSIAATLKANPTLGGVVDNANMELVRGYGITEWAGQQYLGAQIPVTVMCSTP